MDTKKENLFWLRVFITAAAVLTLAMGFAYCVGQQVLRSSANDPQMEIVESVAPVLEGGQDAAALGGQEPVDMAANLSAFLIAYDQDGKLIAGNGMLDGKTPEPPKGVFDAAKKKGTHALTWQPKKGVRIAAVIRSYGGEKPGFILAGKSLREVEARTKNLLMLTGLAWLFALGVSLVVSLALFRRKQAADTAPAPTPSPSK